MSAKHPDASVQSITTASATFFALGIAFFGYWAFNSNTGTPWGAWDFITIILCIIAFINLALVPWIITKPSEHSVFTESIHRARRTFLVGTIALLAAISSALAPGFVLSIRKMFY
jgi:hypothetical protein